MGVLSPGCCFSWASSITSSHMESDSSGLLPELCKVVTRQCNYLNWCSRILQFFINATILLLRVSQNSLDFPIVLSMGQSSEYCQTNLFYAGKGRLPVVVGNKKLIGLGHVKLKDIMEFSEWLIQRFKWVYVYILTCMYTFYPVWNRENPPKKCFSKY